MPHNIAWCRRCQEPIIWSHCPAHPEYETLQSRAPHDVIDIPIIPPGTPPEQILNLVGDAWKGYMLVDNHEADWRACSYDNVPHKLSGPLPRCFVVIPRTEAADE